MSLSLTSLVRSIIRNLSRSGRRQSHTEKKGPTAAVVLEIRQVPSATSLGVMDGNSLMLDAHEADDTGLVADQIEAEFKFGLPGDTVFIGNWAGNGSGPVAVRQPGVNGAPNDGLVHWYMDTDGNLVADKHVAFGLAGDSPVVGDWNGDGRDDIGVTRKSGGAGVANDGLLNWFLQSSSSPTGYTHRKYGFSSDTPVVGNWDGKGGDDLGIVRPNAAGNLVWMQDLNGDMQPDRFLNFGRMGDRPVTGDWDDSGDDNIGVARNTGNNSLQWLLDTNGDSTAEVDRTLSAKGTTPIVFNWNDDVSTNQTATTRSSSNAPMLQHVWGSLDLRGGQVSTSNSPVAVSTTLQNGESITYYFGVGYDSFLKSIRGMSFAHQIGRAEGSAWTVNVRDQPGRFMAFGQDLSLKTGQHSAKVKLSVDNNTADNNQILTIDVLDSTTGRVVASKAIRRKDFRQANSYQSFEITFQATQGHRYQVRTYWHGGAAVKLAGVSIYQRKR